MSRPNNALTRRSLLKGAVLAALATSAPSLLWARQRSAPRSLDRIHPSGTLRIGVLLPRAALYGAAGTSLLSGLQHGVRSRGADHLRGEPVLLPAETGFGPDIVEPARRLVEGEGVDVVVALAGANVAPYLYELFERHETPLLVNDVGANVPYPGERHRFVFHNTFAFWEASYAAGQWAARRLGRRALLATSFYESGYDAPYVFRLGYERAGGQVVETHITHVPGAGDRLPALLDAVRRLRPDVVAAHYSGAAADEFVAAYARESSTDRVPVIGSAFMVDEARLRVQGGAAEGMYTVLPWSGSLDGVPPSPFASVSYVGGGADVFTVLGHESARLLLSAAEISGGSMRGNPAFVEALRHARVDGPRPDLEMDPATQRTRSPLYLRQLRRQGRAPAHVPLEKWDTSLVAEEVWPSNDGPRTGWVHPYLCV